MACQDWVDANIKLGVLLVQDQVTINSFWTGSQKEKGMSLFYISPEGSRALEVITWFPPKS